MKINVSIDDELVARVDKYAEANYMSRSGLISQALNQYLSSKEAVMRLSEITLAMQKIADNNEITEDQKREIEDWQRLARMIVKA